MDNTIDGFDSHTVTKVHDLIMRTSLYNNCWHSSSCTVFLPRFREWELKLRRSLNGGEYSELRGNPKPHRQTEWVRRTEERAKVGYSIAHTHGKCVWEGVYTKYAPSCKP